MSSIYNIKPFQYVHILDKNQNKRRLLEGPVNYAVQDHEVVIENKINEMITIPNLFQVTITNPVERDENGIVLDKFGNPKNRWGIKEVRTRESYNRPFPLYPYEEISTLKEMSFIDQDLAYHLRALLPFTDEDGEHNIGDEWMVTGPRYFLERPEVLLVKSVKRWTIIKPNALRLKAIKNFKDVYGKDRRAGEEWLIYEEGSYLPSVFEEVKGTVTAVTIDDNKSVHLRARNNFVDAYGNNRNAGEEWIITRETSPFHTCGIYEELVGIEDRVVLTVNQYAVIENPYNTEIKKNDLGKLKLVKGETNFFLNPGEIMREIKNVYILTDQDALLLQAIESYKDEAGEKKACGEKWMIRGPCRFIPPVEVKVLERREVIPLDKNEGIYIRNKTTGEVKTHIGSSYLLQPNEVLWQKEMPSNIENIYLNDQSILSRDKSRIVTYKCPFNSVMQIYNLKEKSSRIILGPNLVILGPDEQFCLMSLSGSTPKVEGVVKTLYLRLGPMFSTDEFLVETSDHTRLTLKIGYNWQFLVNNSEEAKSIFSVRDFIGDLCNTMGSRIRSYIATITFEDFHKNSDLYIKKSVFGEDDEGKIKNSVYFDVCKLLVTDVDIKSVIPTDPNTKLLLEKSVSLAIELTTKTIEQEFNIQAKIKEQEFKGELEKLQINNLIRYTGKSLELNKLKTESEIIEKTGLSRAQALAKKDAVLIESKAEVEYTKKMQEAEEIETVFEINKIKKVYDNEYLEKSEDERIELKKLQTLNEIETNKFQKIIESIGADTLVEIAKAGPELQARLLSGLNLSGYILTDGNNPINLFNVADNLTKQNNNFTEN